MADRYCMHGQHFVPEEKMRKIVTTRTRVLCIDCIAKIAALRPAICGTAGRKPKPAAKKGIK